MTFGVFFASFIEVRANIFGRESSSHHHTSSSAEAKPGSLRKQENLLSGLIFIGRRRQKSCQNEPVNSRQLELPHPPGMDKRRVSPDPSPLLNASPLLWWGCGVRQKGKKV